MESPCGRSQTPQIRSLRQPTRMADFYGGREWRGHPAAVLWARLHTLRRDPSGIVPQPSSPQGEGKVGALHGIACRSPSADAMPLPHRDWPSEPRPGSSAVRPLIPGPLAVPPAESKRQSAAGGTAERSGCRRAASQACLPNLTLQGPTLGLIRLCNPFTLRARVPPWVPPGAARVGCLAPDGWHTHIGLASMGVGR